jgi:hypothetical protein
LRRVFTAFSAVWELYLSVFSNEARMESSLRRAVDRTASAMMLISASRSCSGDNEDEGGDGVREPGGGVPDVKRRRASGPEVPHGVGDEVHDEP